MIALNFIYFLHLLISSYCPTIERESERKRMGKKEGFFLNRLRAHVRVQPPTTTSHHTCSQEPPNASAETKGRSIMVVVDSCSEAKNALLWTLSHCAQPQDSILLLHFLKAKPSQSGRFSFSNFPQNWLLLFILNLLVWKK